MKISRSELREKIMIILYQIYLYKKENIEFETNDVIKKIYTQDNNFINDIVYGVIDKETSLDKIINKYLTDWSIDRLGMTDRAILRLSTYELLYYDTPNIVCINEGVELAKKYSDEKVVKMINATLDKIFKSEATHE